MSLFCPLVFSRVSSCSPRFLRIEPALGFVFVFDAQVMEEQPQAGAGAS